jgi:L-ascorbate metabolism protein UlaG (beta-lactamase superfamily)
MDTSVGLLGRLHWLGHASFRLDGPPTIYLDPWRLKGRLPQADLILISHDHHDHCSPDDVKRISGPGTVIVANATAAKKLRGDVRALRPGERTTVGEVEIEAVPAYNVVKSYHPRQAGHVGFIVTVGGERLYFAGDTDRIPEMVDITCDVALLPVGGNYTMDAAEAAAAAADIEPRVAVPMHWGAGVAGTRDDAERFRSLYDGQVAILEAE